MIVAFCGHANYKENLQHKALIFEILQRNAVSTHIDFYLGEYGNFDFFAYNCAKEFKNLHPEASLIFVTPYIPTDSHKNIISKKDRFDSILYPPLEQVPQRYAISHRNRWIVEQADLLISYITHEYGGAYATYRYAKRKNVKIYNLANEIK